MIYKGVTKAVPADMVATMHRAGAVVVDAPTADTSPATVTAAPAPVVMEYKGVRKEVPADMIATMTRAGAVVVQPEAPKAAGRARSFANALTSGLGEKVAGAAARYGDAYGKGEGFVDAASRLASEAASDYAGAIKDVASDPLKAIPGMPSPTTVARAVGLMAPEQLTPETQHGRDEYRAQLAADEAADPVGTNVAGAAGHVVGALAFPGSAGVARSTIAKIPGAAAPVAATAKAVGAELVKEVPGVRVLAKLSSIHERAQAVAPAVEKLASMKRFGAPAKAQEEFLRTLRTKHGPEFMGKVADLAGLSTKGI